MIHRKTTLLLSLFALLTAASIFLMHAVLADTVLPEKSNTSGDEVILATSCPFLGPDTQLRWFLYFLYTASAPAFLFGWLSGWRHWLWVSVLPVLTVTGIHLWLNLATGGNNVSIFCNGMVWSGPAYKIAISVLGILFSLLNLNFIVRFILMLKKSFWFIQPPQDPKHLRRYLMGIYLSHASFFLILLGAVVLFIRIYIL